MSQMIWLFKHNFQLLLHSKLRLLLLIALPIISIIIYFFAYGITGSPSNIHLAIVNQDKGTYTNQLTKMIKEDTLAAKSLNYQEGEKLLINGQIDGLLVIQKGANSALAKGSPHHLKIVSYQSGATSRVLKQLFENNIQKLLKIKALGPKADFSKNATIFAQNKLPLKQQDLTDTSDMEKMMTAQIIGFLCMTLLFAAGNLGELILQEKEDGTFFRLMSTPLSSKKYLSGNTAFYYFTLIFEVILCLTLMRYAFHINPGLPLVTLFIVLALFAFTAVSISLAFSFLAKSRRSISALQIVVFTISTLLSGALIPLMIMPEVMQRIALFMPQYWVMDAISKLQHNGTIIDIWLNICILLIYSLLFLSFASYQYKRNQSVSSFI